MDCYELMRSHLSLMYDDSSIHTIYLKAISYQIFGTRPRALHFASSTHSENFNSMMICQNQGNRKVINSDSELVNFEQRLNRGDEIDEIGRAVT